MDNEILPFPFGNNFQNTLRKSANTPLSFFILQSLLFVDEYFAQQIRVRIWCNSEKWFNNSWLLIDLEVENKSATPYSSKKDS